MNQILDYNPNNKGGRNSSGSDNIVRVFAVIIIIFAIVLVASGVSGILKSKKTESTGTTQVEKANIDVIQEESQAVIKVSHSKAIEKIIYSWNNGKETTIKATGESSVEQIIPLPAGENTLHIKVIDIDGEESTYEGQFISENGEDIINPIINLSVTENKKLKITATDETSLDFITYHWNNDEEIKIEASEEDKTKIEAEIEILKGVNDITVVAVDSNNNTTTEVKSYTGLTKPEIIITVSADKKVADIYAKHENGLTEVSLVLNNTEYGVDIGEKPTEVQFQIELAEGENTITVKATSVDGTKTEATEQVSNNTIEPTATEPTASIEKSGDGQKAIMKAYFDKGIKEIKFNVNDVDYLVDIGENPTQVEFEFPLLDGNNRITFTVVPTEGTEKQVVQEIAK